MKTIALLVLVLALVGCEKAPEKPALVTINDYSISPEEFEMEFRNSPVSKKNTVEARKQFLEILINRKLILQEAQRLGLDKEPDFLKSIERFWEQSLLKAYYDRKSADVVGKVFISESAIEAAYQKLQAEGKADKPYGEMYAGLKWELIREKQAQLMDEVLEVLKKRASIKENLGYLKAH